MGGLRKRLRLFFNWVKQPFMKGKRENLRIFLFCFITAGFFWGMNSLNKNYYTDVKLPLNVKYNDSTLIPLEPLPTEVNIQVLGYGWDLIRWTFGWKVEPMDLIPDGLPEQETVNLSEYRSQITAKLQGIELIQLGQRELPVNFDYLTRKRVPVVYDSASFPLARDRFFRSRVFVDPDSLEFIGPESLLKNLKDQYSVSLEFNEIDEDFGEKIEVEFPHTGLVSVDHEDINLTFQVGQLIWFEKELKPKLRFGNSVIPDSFSIEPKSLMLRYYIPKAWRERFQNDSTIAFINLDNWQSSDSLMDVMLENAPDSIWDLEIRPQAVKVKLYGPS